jgi:hypothetical protein
MGPLRGLNDILDKAVWTHQKFRGGGDGMWCKSRNSVRGGEVAMASCEGAPESCLQPWCWVTTLDHQYNSEVMKAQTDAQKWTKDLPSAKKKPRIMWCISSFFRCCKAPCEWNLKKLVRSGKRTIRWRECDQPGPVDNLFSSLKMTCLKMTCLKGKWVFCVLWFAIYDFWYLYFNRPPFLNGLR